LLLQVTGFVSRFKQALAGQMRNHQLTLAHLTNKVASPNQIIAVYWQKIDYLEQQLQFQMHQLLYKKRQNLLTYTTRVQFQSPVYKLQHIKSRLDQLMRQLTQKIKGEVQSLRHHLNKNLSTLHAVSPLATLDRGYSITTHQDKVIDDIKSLHLGDLVSIRLAQGLLGCEIRTITELHHD
jgi:exodeoxyribonuclease VII large subunit